MSVSCTKMFLRYDQESDQALRDAILAFPSVVPLLADKADIVLPGDLRGHPAFRVLSDSRYYTPHFSCQCFLIFCSSLDEHDSVMHLLSHLYAFRSSSLWKTASNASWLKEVSVSAFAEIKKGRNMEEHPLRQRFTLMLSSKRLDNKGAGTSSQPSLSLSIFRHAYLLSDVNAARRLTSFVPKEILHTATLSCDPLPPTTLVSKYDKTYFSGTDDIFFARELEPRLVHDNVARQHLRVCFFQNYTHI